LRFVRWLPTISTRVARGSVLSACSCVSVLVDEGLPVGIATSASPTSSSGWHGHGASGIGRALKGVSMLTPSLGL
jgi:hypothetical protein